MKERIGKISIVALLILVSVLMVVNMFMSATTARLVNPLVIPQAGTVQLAGDVWYVDGNRPNDGGNGKSWADAYQLLSTALAASQTDISRSADRQWAGRNTIYVKGDMIDEDITKLAQKTDVIGVGSNDHSSRAGVSGNWSIDSTTNYQGCHFYNMDFSDTDAGGVLWDIDGQSGIWFINCLFDWAATDTVGLKASDCSWLRVEDCDFVSDSGGAGFSTAAIQIDQDNAFYNAKILNNVITGAIGIDWNETSSVNCLIKGNVIHSIGLTIDCEDDKVMVVGNYLMTDLDTDAYAVGTGWDWNDVTYGSNNYLMGSGSAKKANQIPPEEAD